MKKTILAAAMMLAGLTFGITANAQGKKIGMKRARAIAARQVVGTIKSGELEHEHGKWIYSFDIRNRKGTITEVNIDAYTGKVISTDVENANKEAAEKRQEMKEKKNS